MIANLATSWLAQPKKAARRRRRPIVRLGIEHLEDRTLLAAGSTFVVNNLLDALPLHPDTNDPTDASNLISLRSAVAAADVDSANGISDTITFDSSLGSATIDLTVGTLELSGTGTITIDGSAPSLPVTIDGSQQTGRLFQVGAGTTAVIQNIVLRKGNTTTGNGGAIQNAGTVTVNNATISGNQAAAGGAIENSGNVTLSNTVLYDNHASGTGGALDNTGTATVIDSTFDGGGAGAPNSALNGGAIASAGTLTVSGSTFTRNYADTNTGAGGAIDIISGSAAITGSTFVNGNAFNGGAIENSAILSLTSSVLSNDTAHNNGSAIDNSGTLTVVSSTISSNNVGNGTGGGINNSGGTVTVTGSTFSGNAGYSAGLAIASSSGSVILKDSTIAASFGDGSAIQSGGTLTLQNVTVSGNTDTNAIVNSGGTLTLQNTIVAGNTNSATTGDIAGSITTDLGHNLLGTAANNKTTIPTPGSGDVFSDSPGLGALGNYGGSTQTLDVLVGSPAIGAGNAGAAGLPATDQRGLPRTVGGKLDIGAFQTQPPALVFTTLGQTTNAGQSVAVTLELTDLDGNSAVAGSGGVAVALVTSSTTGSFFDSLGNAISGNTLIVPTGSSSALFRYADTTAGKPTLSASASGYTSATQQETILPPPIAATPVTDIVVGRTLSTYFAGDIQNGQETITFTVYNQSSDSLTGVLLTDTLASGVTLVSASQQPDQSGQNLAWSLGTIDGDYWTSVSITVSLANSGILQLDSGAQAYATLDAGAVSNATPAAVLSTGTVDPNLLAATPDANTNDPFIQQEAAILDYNPQNIFNFLEQNVGYNAYPGSLRGARGTLWSNAGNALDVASLGVALMRASGIPAQYVEGTLSQEQADALVLSMFPSSYQTVGYIPAGTTVATATSIEQTAGADGLTLEQETENHYWFEFNTGSGWVNADPLMAAITLGGAIGQAYTAPSGTFTQVLQSLEQTTEVSLTAEIYSQGAAVFGLGDGLSDTVVLDQTFDDAELAGRPLTFGNHVSESTVGSIYSYTNIIYSPYIAVGNYANPNPSNDNIINGCTYQEVYTNYPLENNVLTGLFLDVDLKGPGSGGNYEKTLYDAIGASARASGAGISVSPNSNGTPALTDLDVFTLNVQTGSSAPNTPGQLPAILTKLKNQISTIDLSVPASLPQDSTLLTDSVIAITQIISDTFLTTSDVITDRLASDTFVRSYSDTPRLIVAEYKTSTSPTVQNPTESINFDLIRDSVRAVAAPGQSASVVRGFQALRGISESDQEERVIEALLPPSQNRLSSISAAAVFRAAAAEGVPLVVVSSGSQTLLNGLGVSADVKARITAALAAGEWIILPATPVTINGGQVTAWYEVDPNTGETTGVTQSGEHGEELEEVVTELIAPSSFGNAFFYWGISNAIIVAIVAIGYALAVNSLPPYLVDIRELVTTGSTFQVAGLTGLGNQFPALIESTIGTTLPIAPNISTFLNPQPPSALQPGWASADIPTSVSENSGLVTANAQTNGIEMTGSMSATWTSSDSRSFTISTFNAATAVVMDSTGGVVGSGTVSITPSGSTPVMVDGDVTYTITGVGTLAEYARTPIAPGWSTDWDAYTATLSGSTVLSITTDSLDLDGNRLPAGTYLIRAASATLTGSGPGGTPPPDAVATIQATGAAVTLSPFTGSFSVSGIALGGEGGVTLSGFTGTMTLSAATSSESVVISGDTTGVISLAATPSTLTTDQNHSASVQIDISTTDQAVYHTDVDSPPGWTANINGAGVVTITTPPGIQPGVYPVRLTSKLLSEPFFVSQLIIDVSVSMVTPGEQLTVAPDPQYTVPFGGSQIPTAFRATVRNLGITADTYTLSVGIPPAGFSLVTSVSELTVPAGQTGVDGVYLIPNGTALPAPGTVVSFPVTATSTTNPSMTQTVTVTFTVPAIDAVTVTSNPVQVSALPGQPTTATVTLQNVGNVKASAALNFTTESGLTLTGLSAAPVVLDIGQSTTETIQLTPDASVPLNSLLQASVIVGPAPTQNLVSVVNVDPSTNSAAEGQTVAVSADLLTGVTATEQAQASFTVVNSSGNTVFTSTPVPVTLSNLTGVTKISLGNLNTTSIAPGSYTIVVSIADSSGTPISGATASTTLTINAPVAASLSVSSDAISPTDSLTVANTLTVGSPTLLGQLATDGEATSVVVSGNLAYVANTQDIAVVNVSDPTNPRVVTTFGASDINAGGLTLLQLDGSNLVVVSQSTSGASSFNLLVYSLANPSSPQLLSNTTIPYAFANGLVIQGNTAIIPISTVATDGNGNVTDQAGDVLTVDLTNPAAPTLSGVLFNDRGQPLGGDSNQNDVIPVTSQVAYASGSTSTGINTQIGAGRVTIVNTSNPANLSVAGTLDIPGTVQILGIGINGTQALVVGNSGGWQTPYADFGLTGSITLTLLDISNPLAPTVVGATVVTQDQFPTVGENAVGKLQVVYLGNGEYAVSDVQAGAAPVLLIVNVSGSNAITTSTVAAPSDINGMTLSGGLLLATTGAGLSIYQVNALTTQTVTASVTVPISGTAAVVPNSFSVQPNQVIPGNGTETLVWNLTLTPGSAPQQISWQTTLTGLAAGQVVPVVTGATIQDGSTTYTLPASNVAGVPETQTIQIPVEVTAPGVQAIENAGTAAGQAGDTNLANQLNNLGTALTSLVKSPTSAVDLSEVIAALTSLITLVETDPFLAPFAAGLITARTAFQNATTAAEIDSAATTLGTALAGLAQAITDEAAHGFTLSFANPNGTIQPGSPTIYTIDLRNVGSQTSTYDLSVSGLPAGVTATLSQSKVTLASGAAVPNSTTTVTLSLSESGATLIPATFTLTATAETAPEITLGTQGQLGLRPESLLVGAVTTNPPFTNAGGLVDVTAKILATVNENRQAAVSYIVTDSSGTALYNDSSPVTIILTSASGLNTVDLGSFNTTGFADGVDAITVTVTDLSASPLPAATGVGNVTVGSPVTATLSTSPTVLPTGSPTTTTSVQINSSLALPNPLTLENVTTTTSATSVAVYQDTVDNKKLAYVAGPNGIDIVDVTTPASPSDLGTFGQSDIINGGLTVCRVDTIGGADYLIVGATSQTSYGSLAPFTLLIYSLATPLSPQLVSSTPGFPDPFNGDQYTNGFLNDMVVSGNTVLIPSYAFSYFGGLFQGQGGNVIAIDVSNPASPQLVGVLYPGPTNPDSQTSQFSVVQVNSQYAYVASSTTTGDTTTGTGRVVVVNDSNPASLTYTSLSIPGTYQVFSIAVQGNTAIVVGRTSGPGSDGTNLLGTMTISLLDITDPANPQLIGTTIDTNATFPTSTTGVAKLSAVALGNGVFAVSEAEVSGNTELVLVDASVPTNPLVSYTQVPALVNEMDVSNGLLYATSSSTADGLMIYSIGQLTNIPVTLTVQVPTGAGVSVVPTSLAVAGAFSTAPPQLATGATTDTITWSGTLTPGASDVTLGWNSTVADLGAGQAVTVASGGTVGFTSQGTTGSVPLGPATVTGSPIIRLSPATQTAQPGGTVTYVAQLSNPTAASITYALNAQFVPSDNFVAVINSGANMVTVAPGMTVEAPVQVTPYRDAPVGTEPVVLEAQDQYGGTGADGTASSTLVVAGPPVVQADPVAHGVALALAPTTATVGLGTSTQYVIQVTNTGSADDRYTLQVTGLPAGVSYAFDGTYTTAGEVDVPPGAGNFRDITLTLTSAGATAGAYPFTVVAVSEVDAAETGLAPGSLTVSPAGVSVSLDPPAGPPGTGYQLTVVNQGAFQDTFQLSLAGPAGLVATLGQPTVTLAAGASQTIPITTGAVNFAVAGGLGLIATATSETNTAVTASASAGLTIPNTTGMTAKFRPAAQTLNQPGAATFTLLVDNTGNEQDSYTATIAGTTGPVTASLTGLDGQPAQTVPLFILPGLATGELSLPVASSALGAGTVTVTVTSLTNPAISTTVTATLNAQAAVATTTAVTSDHPGGAGYGTPVSFTATVTAAGGPPAGSVQFQIDGASAGSPVALTNGTATLSTAALGAGTHHVVAFFSSTSGRFLNSDDLAAPLSLTVIPAVLTVAPADGQSKVYGAAVPVLAGTPSGFENGDTSAVLTGQLGTTATAASPVGNYAFDLGSLRAGANYTLQLASSPPTFAVTPAVLTVTPTAGQSVAAGSALPVLTGSVSGLVNADPPSVLTGQLGTTATSASPAGNYPFTLGTLTAGPNYTLQLAANSPVFTVIPAMVPTPPPPPPGSAVLLTTSRPAPSDGQDVVLTATVPTLPGVGPPMGTITFIDSGVTLGTVTVVNGTATLTTTALPIGTSQVIASYSGDPTYAAGVSSAVSEDVQAVREGKGQIYVVGAGPGGGPRVEVFDAATNTQRFNFFAFDSSLRGGVSVASGDVNGDGVEDVIVGAGFGGGAEVKVYDGQTGALITSWFAYDPSFRGGVWVAAEDLYGNGRSEVVTGPGVGGGPVVEVWDLEGSTQTLVTSFAAYEPAFRGGVTVATGLASDGRPDIVVGAGPGGGPRVRTFDAITQSLLSDVFVYEPSFSGGVYVSAGDVLGTGTGTQILVGPGPGGGPRLEVLGTDGSIETNVFAAVDTSLRNGLTIAAVDRAGSAASVLVGAGLGAYQGTVDGETLGGLQRVGFFEDGFDGGVFVG